MTGWALSGALFLVLSLMGSLPDSAIARDSQGPAGAARSAEDSQDEVVRAMEHAYAGSEFWWKRQQQVETPWYSMKLLGDLIIKFFKFLGSIIGPVIELGFYFLRDIWYALRNLLGFLPALGMESGTIALSLLLIALIGWVIWKVHPLVWQWLKSAEVPARERQPQVAAQEELPEARLLLNQAAEMMQQGKYREAMRFAFLALLACLQNRGLLRYDRSRTNREYLSDLREVPHLAVIFREATRPYERAWYGQAPVTNAETEYVLGVCRQLVAQEEAKR